MNETNKINLGCCRHCVFFVYNETRNWPTRGEEDGTCHAHPPVVIDSLVDKALHYEALQLEGDKNMTVIKDATVHPVVTVSDFCKEFIAQADVNFKE